MFSAERDTSVASEVQSLLAKEELSQLQSDLIDSLFTDLYAATTDKISLPGAIAEGYDGYHELVSTFARPVFPFPPAGHHLSLEVASHAFLCPLRYAAVISR